MSVAGSARQGMAVGRANNCMHMPWAKCYAYAVWPACEGRVACSFLHMLHACLTCYSPFAQLFSAAVVVNVEIVAKSVDIFPMITFSDAWQPLLLHFQCCNNDLFSIIYYLYLFNNITVRFSLCHLLPCWQFNCCLRFTCFFFILILTKLVFVIIS